MRTDLYEDMYKTEETHWWHRAKRTVVCNILNTLGSKKELKILDVGCGTGKNLESFSVFGEVWGVDSADEAIYFCKQRLQENVIKASIDKIPLPDEGWDVITLLDVLEHVDQETALPELKRLLRPKGNIIITVPAFPSLWSQWDVILHHKKRYTFFSLTQALIQHGYTVDMIRYMHSYLFIPAYLMRKFKNQHPNGEYRSDFEHSNALINAIFSFLFKTELYLSRFFTIPFGTSIICLAHKP